MTMTARHVAGALAVVLAGLTGACTSSDGPDPATPGTASGSAASGSTTSGGTGPGGTAATGSGVTGSGVSGAPQPAPSSSSPAAPGTAVASSPPTGSGTPAPAPTRRQIVAAYADFFRGASSLATSQAALQHGAAFRKALQEQADGAFANSSAVRVGAVRIRGDLGYVTFTITSNGDPLLSDFQGYAVRERGRWKVAAITFCTLLQLQGGAPLACNDPTLTALPL